MDTEESDIAAEDENDDDLTSGITNHVTITDLAEEDEFKSLNPLPVDSPVLMIEVGVNSPDFNDFLHRSINLKGHLLSDFTTELQTHSSCPFHCMELLNAKASCKNHCDICNVCAERFTLFDDLLSTVTSSSLNTIRKCYYEKELRNIQECLHLYVAHLVRGKYQRLQFMKEVDSSKPGKALVVCDYMMKLLLHKFREPQRDWYGKNGVSVHGSMFFFRSDDSADIQVEIHDVFSNGD